MKFTIQFTFNTKFLQHMAYDISAFGELGAYQPGSLFDQYHSCKNPNEHKFIFAASAINTEIISFIHETEHKQNVFLYFDEFNKSLHSDAVKNNIPCLVHAKDMANIKNLKSSIKIDHMYSEQLLNSFDKTRVIPNINIITNLNSYSQLPDALSSVLYPNEKIDIKMFDGGQINHIQNLGWVDDKTYIELINNCQILIALDNMYLAYGLILQKPTIALTSNNWIKKSELTKDILLNPKLIPEPSLSIKDIRSGSFKNFIEKHLL